MATTVEVKPLGSTRWRKVSKKLTFEELDKLYGEYNYRVKGTYKTKGKKYWK